MLLKNCNLQVENILIESVLVEIQIKETIISMVF